MRRLWKRFGSLPAVGVVSALIASLIVCFGVLSSAAADDALVVLLLVFAAYCIARPRHGLEVFAIPGLLGVPTTWILHQLGLPKGFGLLLIPTALYLAWDEDQQLKRQREKERAAAEQPA